MFDAIIESPIGKLGITLAKGRLSRISFLPFNTDTKNSSLSVIQSIHQELEQFFRNPQHQFNLDYQLMGTDFQRRVWDALTKIHCGDTVSYKWLAATLQTSPRAIGNACRANPIPLIIPCHRVVALNHIGGFAGQTQGELLDIKKWLLAHEKRHA